MSLESCIAGVVRRGSTDLLLVKRVFRWSDCHGQLQQLQQQRAQVINAFLLNIKS